MLSHSALEWRPANAAAARLKSKNAHCQLDIGNGSIFPHLSLGDPL